MPQRPRPLRRRPRSDAPLLESSDVPPGLLGQDRSRSRQSAQELTWAQFDEVVRGLAREIAGTYRPDLVVGIAHGGLFVGAALASALGVPFFPVRITRRSRDAGVRRMPRVTGDVPDEVDGARVLLVDDVAASGDTLELARSLALRAGAREVRSATLLCRDQGFVPDWTVLVVDGPVVFPWDYGPVTEDGRFELGVTPPAAEPPARAVRRRRSSA